MPFALAPFLLQLAVGVAIQTVGYLILGRTKTEQPTEVSQLEDPTAEPGRPIPVLFGEVEITEVNIIWFGEKRTVTEEVSG